MQSERVDRSSSEVIYDELMEIRRRTRRDLSQDAWRWLLIWAALAFGFVVSVAVPAFHGLAAWYWTVGVPIGLLGTIAADVTRPGANRVRRGEHRYWLVAAAITALNVGGSLVLPLDWLLIWLWAVFAAGFAVFLRLANLPAVSRPLWMLAAVALPMGAASTDRTQTTVVLGLGFVASLLVAAKVSHGARLG